MSDTGMEQQWEAWAAFPEDTRQVVVSALRERSRWFFQHAASCLEYPEHSTRMLEVGAVYSRCVSALSDREAAEAIRRDLCPPPEMIDHAIYWLIDRSGSLRAFAERALVLGLDQRAGRDRALARAFWQAAQVLGYTPISPADRVLREAQVASGWFEGPSTSVDPFVSSSRLGVSKPKDAHRFPLVSGLPFLPGMEVQLSTGVTGIVLDGSEDTGDDAFVIVRFFGPTSDGGGEYDGPVPKGMRHIYSPATCGAILDWCRSQIVTRANYLNTGVTRRLLAAAVWEAEDVWKLAIETTEALKVADEVAADPEIG